MVAQPPTELGKTLRCCVPCRLVKTFEQFYEQASRRLVCGHDPAVRKPQQACRQPAVSSPAAATSPPLLPPPLRCRLL